MTDDADTQNQDESFPDTASVIDAFGGVRPMASRLGVAATTVQGWKSRGHIPEMRWSEVREKAEEAGVDLSGLPTARVEQAAATEESEALPEEIPADAMPETRSAPGVTATGSSGKGVAWLALAVAIAVGGALYTQPNWSPLLYGPSGQEISSDVLVRLDALESKPSPPSLAPLTARLDAFDAALKALPSAVEAGPDLSPRLDELSAELDSRAGQIGALTSRFDETATGLRADLGSVTEQVQSEVAALREEIAALGARLDALQARNAAATGRTTGFTLAVVSLEQAVMAGEPFTGALVAVERLSGGAPEVAAAISELTPYAAEGIPTASALAQRFGGIASTLGEPLWSATGVTWVDKILTNVDSLVSVRRIEDSSGKALPSRQAEQAVAAGDLEAAAAALGDAKGPAADWIRDARRRIAADKAVAALRLQAVEMLGKGLSDAGAPQ